MNVINGLVWIFIIGVFGAIGALIRDKIGLVGTLIVCVIGFIIFVGLVGGRRDPFAEKQKRLKERATPIRVKHDKFFKVARRYRNTYIGYDRINKHPLYLNLLDRTRHLHVIGSTGSGKSVLLFNIFRQDVASGYFCIFIDAKGDIENLTKVRRICKEAGRLKDLLVFTIGGPANTYNPLLHGNATQLKDTLVSAIVWSEVYYKRVCENLLQLLFSAVNKVLTLKQVYEVLKEPRDVYRYSGEAQKEAAIEFVDFAETHKREKTTLMSELGLVVYSDFYEKLDTVSPEINFYNCIDQNKIIYFGIDVQSYQETSKRLGRMIVGDINTVSGLIQTQIPESKRRYVSIIIDEFGAFGTESFINTLARGRSSKFMITISHQSLADLETIQRNFSKTVIDNTYTKLILQINDPQTIETMVKMIGTHKDFEYTKQVVYSGSSLDREMGSVRLVDSYIIHPNEIRQLRVGEAVYKSGRLAGLIQIPYC